MNKATIPARCPHITTSTTEGEAAARDRLRQCTLSCDVELGLPATDKRHRNRTEWDHNAAVDGRAGADINDVDPYTWSSPLQSCAWRIRRLQRAALPTDAPHAGRGHRVRNRSRRSVRAGCGVESHRSIDRSERPRSISGACRTPWSGSDCAHRSPALDRQPADLCPFER
jgi:hypothetical protein